MAEAPTVAVLTRAPAAGGKTRLFAALGRAPDPSLLEALFLDTLDGVLASGYAVLVGVEPADGVDRVRAIVPPGVVVVPQGAGDLGDRMRALMATAFDRGATAVALVGSDLPDLSPAPLRDAVARLVHDPDALVLGPAADGGYYLIAATRVPDVFTGVEWGSTQVLRQTETAAARAGFRSCRVGVLRDVDAPSDLRRVQGRRTAAWARRAGVV